MNYRVHYWFMNIKWYNKIKKSKHCKSPLTISLRHHLKSIEEETEVKLEIDDTMTIDNNKNLKITRFMNLKGEEEVEAITIPTLIAKVRKKNPILSALDATYMVFISLNVKPIWIKSMVKNLTL